MTIEPVNSANVGDVDWWWTPDCGAIHTERNPVVIDAHCSGWGTDWGTDRRSRMRALADEIVGRYWKALDRLGGKS